MILIYTDKPHLGKILKEKLIQEIKEAYPNQNIVVIHQLHIYNLQFAYPKKLRWSDYPFIGEPEYKFNENWEAWRPVDITTTSKQITLTTEELKNVDTIIYADDAYSTNCHNFDLFIKHFFAHKKVHLPALNLFHLDRQSVLEAWNNRCDFYVLFSEKIKQGKIKRYFNYNYNINSFGIFGYVLRELGIDTNQYHMSKFALQLLYAFREISQQTIDRNTRKKSITYVVQLMHTWQGTGKYKRTKSYEGRLGSETSSLYILNSLVDMKLVEVTKYGKIEEYQITPLGELFLSNLHKDCQDKDLPFRYELWQNEAEDVGLSKIQEYLKNFFGKQKRILNRYVAI